MVKLRKAISLQSKRPKFCHFQGLKAIGRKNYHCRALFYFKILKAVCLTFDWVPKLIQISFQAMEQKLFQRCETKADADACKASYLLSSNQIKQNWTKHYLLGCSGSASVVLVVLVVPNSLSVFGIETSG